MKRHVLRIGLLIVLTIAFCVLKFSSISNSSNGIGDAAPFGQMKESEFEGIKYHYYIPFSAGALGERKLPVLVLIPSRQQDPLEIVERWIESAEDKKIGIIVPTFNQDHAAAFPDLQKYREDFRLIKILDHSKKVWRFEEGPIYMFGHDEGGEFVHRFAIIHPEMIKKAVISGVTRYTFPDVSVAYPFGIRYDPNLKDVKFRINDFIKLNMAIIVGKFDDDPIRGDGAAKQGQNRVERAQNFYNAMQTYAKNNSRKCSLSLEIIPEGTHDYKTTVNAARDFLFKE